MIFIDLKSGTTFGGEEIKSYRSEKKADKWVYLMAGVHGDEVEGVYVMAQLFEWLKATDSVDLPLIVIPVLNVDGYRTGTRTNARGVDLNRNLPSKSWQPEARASKYFPGESAMSEMENQYLDKLFQKYPPKFILSFHSWKPMLNYNGNCKEAAEFLEKYNNYPVCDDIEGHPTPGSLGDYAPETYQSPVLTFECPVLSESIGLKDIWEENREGLTGLLTSAILKK